MMRTSTPCALASVNTSTALPSGMLPNPACVTDMAAVNTIAAAMSRPDEIRDPDRLLLVVESVDRRHQQQIRLRLVHHFVDAREADSTGDMSWLLAAASYHDLRQNALTLPVKYSTHTPGTACFSSRGRSPSSPAAARGLALRLPR